MTASRTGVLVQSAFLFLLTLTSLPAARADLVFSSAPRDSAEKENALYQPLMTLLSKATGLKVVFRHGDNYLVYQSEMRKGTYDIVFDGPQFVGWRMAKLNHVPVVKFPGNLEFVTIVKKSPGKYNDLKSLVGRTICAFPAPNLATLAVLYEFDNPARQPIIVQVQSFPEVYKGVMSGRCVGGILQSKLYQALDKDAQAMQVVSTTKPTPNQAFTVGPRVTPEMRARITEALLSPAGAAATEKLREIYKVPKLMAAAPDEYNGLGKYLRDVWGFDL